VTNGLVATKVPFCDLSWPYYNKGTIWWLVVTLLQQRYHLVASHELVTTEVPFGD
jgi:hypothetical protein